MPRLEVATFKGQIPKTSSRLLPDNAAELSENCLFDGGDLEPYLNLQEVVPQPILQAVITRALFLYKYGATDEKSWFTSALHTNFIDSPIAEDGDERVYYADENGPRVTDKDIGPSGVLPSPLNSYLLGVPAPAAAPVALVLDAGTDSEPSPTPTNDVSYVYVCTYVNAYGQEGPPSLPSNVVTVEAVGADIQLTMPTGGSLVNPHNITRKRIYRSASTAEGTELFFLWEFDLAFATTNDTLDADEVFSISLQTGDYDPAPQNLAGLAQMANGITVGFAGNTLFFSEPYLPYTFPIIYRRSIIEQIVSIKATQNGLVVGTDGFPYLFNGISPDSMSEYKIEKAESCVSARSMVDMGETVIYASPNGLVAVSDGNVERVTAELFDKRHWEEYQPETIHAYLYEGKYVAFYGDDDDDGVGVGGFIFNPVTLDFTPIDTYATAGYSDLETGKLYLVSNEDGSFKLHEWEGAATNKTFTWKSKLFRFPDVAFNCLKIECADFTDIGLKIWVDSVEVVNYASLPDVEFNLPDAARGRVWQFELTGSTEVFSIVLATSRGELG